MIDEEYEFMLQDRIAKIQAIDIQYDLRNNAYISFSGGKDSTIVSYLIDIALPNNNIPRLFLNTGIEYQLLRKYVKNLSESDNRIVLYNSGINIIKMLQDDGYPFKSKQHAHNWSVYENNKIGFRYFMEMVEKHPNLLNDYEFISALPSGIKTNIKYIYGVREKETPITVDERERGLLTSFKSCPEALKYQFTDEFKLKLSDKCCYRLKKENAMKWQIENNKSITITGIRADEGGMRSIGGCTVFDGDDLKKFHPIKVVSDEWEDEFIKRNNIKLCELYYPPYNFKRTGCKGCPFALDLQNQLLVMKKLLPNEYKQCLHIWKPVYDEYVRLGYRLDKNFYEIKPQFTIDDFLE